MFKTLWLIICSLILFVNCSNAQEIPCRFPCSEKLTDAYGVCAHMDLKGFDGQYIEREMKILKNLGVNYVRVDFRWSLIRSNLKQVYEKYDHLDRLILAAKKNDINILPILGYTLPDCLYPWDDTKSWFSYLDGIYSRYGDFINVWELWNEQNRNNVDAVSYSKLMFLTKSWLHNKSSKNILLFGGLGGIDIKYLRDVNASKYQYQGMDIMNLHYYAHTGGPEWMLEHTFIDLEKSMFSHGLNHHVWMTETGNNTYNEKRGWHKRKHSCSEEEQAIWLPRNYIICFSSGFDKVFYYQLRAYETEIDKGKDHFGILHKDLTPKPAFGAFKTLLRMLPNGSTRPKTFLKNGIYLAEWKNPQGKIVYALWTRDKEKTINLQTKGHYYAYDIYGKKIVKNITKISPAIIYLVGNKNLIVNYK